MISRIGKNARLGDGCMTKQSENGNAGLAFMSTDKDVLHFKKKMCDEEGLIHSDFGTQKSGYGGTKTIWNFRVRTDKRLTLVHDMPIAEVIKSLDESDIYLWLIDDGSWHKNQKLFHLYCNMLNDEETNLLITHIEALFGVSPTMRKDRKQDGRSFNYLYFPRRLTAIIRPKFKKFLLDNELHSMLYKVGGIDFDCHLENLSDEVLASDAYLKISKACATARRFDKDMILAELDDKVTVTWMGKYEKQQRVIMKGESA